MSSKTLPTTGSTSSSAKKRSPKKGFGKKGPSSTSSLTSGGPEGNDDDDDETLPQENAKQVADRLRSAGRVTLELRIAKDEVEALDDDDDEEEEEEGGDGEEDEHEFDANSNRRDGVSSSSTAASNFGFGYKAVHRKEVPVPRTYLELQSLFATAFPWHDETLVVERSDGRMVTPTDCKFVGGDVVVFREYVPTNRRDELKGKIKGLGKGWEEEEYKIQRKSFKLRTWQL
jgi:hypothetical protein